jgi:hypothetical protein
MKWCARLSLAGETKLITPKIFNYEKTAALPGPFACRLFICAGTKEYLRQNFITAGREVIL